MKGVLKEEREGNKRLLTETIRIAGTVEKCGYEFEEGSLRGEIK